MPFVKVSDLRRIENIKGVSCSANYVSRGDIAALGARVIPAGSIVFPKVGAALLGNSRALTLTACVLDNNLMAIIPRDGDVRYWRYALMAIDLSELSGSGPLPYVSDSQVRDLRLFLPAFDEQRRIADFLDAETVKIDRLVAARQTQAATLGQLWGSRLAATIDDQVSVYGWVPLRRVASSVEQGWSPQCDDVAAEPNEWAVLKTSAVSSGEFAPLEHKRLPQGVKHDPRYRIADGDVLMTRGSGSPNHVGMVAEAKTEGRRLLLSDLLYRVRLVPEWSPRFVALALRSHPVRGLMTLLFRGQSGQTIKLRAEDVRSVEVPAVPVSMQAELAAELTAEHVSILSVVRSIETSISLLAERRQALITAAVTGQIDVTTARGASA